MPDITKIQLGENIFADFYYNDPKDRSKGAVLENIIGTGRMFDKKSDWLANGQQFSFSAGYLCMPDLVIPDGITSISENFLSYNSNGPFEKLVFPSNVYIGNDVEEIGRAAFRYYKNMQQLTQRGGVKHIVFKNPAKLKKVGDLAFSAQHLQSINFNGHTPEELGTYLFYNCQELTKIDLGENLDMTYAMFNDCFNLHHFNKNNSIRSFDISDGVSAVHGAMKNCNSIEELTFTEDCIFRNSNGFNPSNTYAYFSVEKYAGSNIDENGNQITVIHGNSTWAMCHSWLKLEGRAVILDTGEKCSRPYLVLNHLGKIVQIPLYPLPDKKRLTNNHTVHDFIPINHCGRTWYAVAGRAVNLSPLIINNSGQSKYINYK